MQSQRINTPLFSVIIPTYNRADRLRTALDSLARQTFKEFEVIVCDDGSTDNTAEIANEFKEKLALTYLHDENWGGPARPRNAGIKWAKGIWISFLDSDDFWYPDKLTSCLPYLENSDVIYHHFEVFGSHMPKNQRILFGRRISKKNAFLDLLLSNWNGMANSGVSVRKSVLDQAGLFDENRRLIGIEDFDMWLRIAKITNRFTLIPMILGGYLVSESSLTRDIEKNIARDFYLLEKYRDDISSQQNDNAIAFINFIGGLRFLRNNDRKSADRYFRLVIKMRCAVFLKIKAIICLILGTHSWTLYNTYKLVTSKYFA